MQYNVNVVVRPLWFLLSVWKILDSEDSEEAEEKKNTIELSKVHEINS